MLLSVVIASRNEKYLQKTILDLLSKAKEEIEIIVTLDGSWSEVCDDPRVSYIHFTKARGMRNALNSAVAVARCKYILKTDAHCMFADGFDVVLKRDHRHKTILIPRRYALDPEKWEIEKRTDNKFPIDVMILNDTLQAIPTTIRKDNALIETESFQGSCWFMTKRYYQKLGLLDEETYGSFYQEAQEIGFKCKKDGGKILCDTNTWYAHWHKVEGRGYSLSEKPDKTREEIKKLYESMND